MDKKPTSDSTSTKGGERQSVRYESSIPSKRLRDWCDRNADKVSAVCYGSGFCTDSGFAYDVMLRSGWCDGNDIVHSIIEQTAAETLAKLRDIAKCDCDQCRAALAKARGE